MPAHESPPAHKSFSLHKLWVGILAFIGVISLVTAGLHGSQASANKEIGEGHVQPVKAIQPPLRSGTLPVAVEVPFTPSQYPGVMVRNVPQLAAVSDDHNRGWIYVKPGAKKPRFGPQYRPRGGGIWYEPGKTTAGGVAAHLDPNFYPYVVAKVQPGGKIALECVEKHNPAQRESLSNGIHSHITAR